MIGEAVVSILAASARHLLTQYAVLKWGARDCGGGGTSLGSIRFHRRLHDLDEDRVRKGI